MMLSLLTTPSLFSSVAMRSVRLWRGVLDFRLLFPLSLVDWLWLIGLVPLIE
jgi:hypothetical protein